MEYFPKSDEMNANFLRFIIKLAQHDYTKDHPLIEILKDILINNTAEDWLSQDFCYSYCERLFKVYLNDLSFNQNIIVKFYKFSDGPIECIIKMLDTIHDCVNYYDPTLEVQTHTLTYFYNIEHFISYMGGEHTFLDICKNKEFNRYYNSIRLINYNFYCKYTKENYCNKNVKKLIGRWYFETTLYNQDKKYRTDLSLAFTGDAKLKSIFITWTKLLLKSIDTEFDNGEIVNVRLARLKAKTTMKRYRRMKNSTEGITMDKVFEHPVFGKYLFGITLVYRKNY